MLLSWTNYNINSKYKIEQIPMPIKIELYRHRLDNNNKDFDYPRYYVNITNI